MDPGIYRVEPTPLQSIGTKFRSLLPGRGPDPFPLGDVIGGTIARVHRSNPLDVVEMEESFGWCATIKDRLPVPVVVKLHGPAFLSLVEEELENPFARMKIEKEGKALSKIDTIISPSHSTLIETLSRYALNPRIQRVVPNPVIIEPGLESWDLEHCDRRTILYVGRFDKRKGGDTMLLAFRKLLEIDASLKLIFVGPDNGVTRADGARIHFDEFKNSLFTEGQRPNITYLGKLERTEIFSLRSAAMLTMVVARWENQANTALEAMLQGCPIVATDTGGMKEILDDGVTGLLARHGDIDDLCQKALLLLRNPVMAQRLGEGARRMVLDRHSAQRAADAAIDVYRQAIAQSTPRKPAASSSRAASNSP